MSALVVTANSLSTRKPSDIFFDGKSKDPRRIVARDVAIFGWLRGEPSPNRYEDFHFAITIDPEVPPMTLSGESLDSLKLPYVADESPIPKISPLPFQDVDTNGNAIGIDLNSFLLPASADNGSDPVLGTQLTNTLKVELNAWDRQERGPPPPGWFQDPVPPSDDPSERNGGYPRAYYPYDPYQFHNGDYVYMVGTLWLDGVHDQPGHMCMKLGGSHCDYMPQDGCWWWSFNNEGWLGPTVGWLEMHPPDEIRHVRRALGSPPKIRHTTIAKIARCGYYSDGDETWGYIVPDWDHPGQVYEVESVQQVIDGRFTDMSSMTINQYGSEKSSVYFHVAVRSKGRFKAIYRIDWKETSCPEGEQLCEEINECAVLSSSSRNCGECGHRCPFGWSCVNGRCKGCSGNLDCAGGQICRDNVCMDPDENCPQGQTFCPCILRCTSSRACDKACGSISSERIMQPLRRVVPIVE